METTNLIGPIDSGTWSCLIKNRQAQKYFRKDEKYTVALQKYEAIYKDTISSLTKAAS